MLKYLPFVSVYSMNYIFQTSLLLNMYVTVKYVEINWLYKHRKKVRSSQASVSVNSSTELGKTQFSQWRSLKISRYSLENTCTGVSLQAIYIVAGHSIIHTQNKKMFFDVFRGCRLGCNFTKKEAPPQIFSCELCEIFKNIFFYRTSPDYCFWRKQFQTKNPDNFTYASEQSVLNVLSWQNALKTQYLA